MTTSYSRSPKSRMRMSQLSIRLTKHHRELNRNLYQELQALKCLHLLSQIPLKKGQLRSGS